MDVSAWHLIPPWLVVAACAACARERARRRRAEHAAAALRVAQENTLRLLRLSTGDQRSVALTLFGHAEAAQPSGLALSGLARRLLDLSETIVEQTEQPGAARIISEEALCLLPLVEFAVAQVGAHLGPARRAWRIDPGFADAQLVADRRAVNQVLVSVLTAAASATRDGDWIELSLRQDAEGTVITVQDEGVGLPVVQSAKRPEESRGIGLRLTLARSLMQAHGGSLTVQSAEQVGTRVRLWFPVASEDRAEALGAPAVMGMR